MRYPLYRWLACALVFCAPAHAIDAIVLEVRELSVAGVPIEGASVRLDLLGDDETRLTVKARAAHLPEPAGRFTDISFDCEKPVIAEPRYACDAGRFRARGGPTGAVDMQARAELHVDTGVTSFSGRGLRVAGTQLSLDGRLDERGWQLDARSATGRLAEWRKFVAPWFALPADITGDGEVRLEAKLADRGAGLIADVAADLGAVDLTNEASTIVTDQLAARARLRMEPRGQDSAIALELEGRSGQALASLVYLDLGGNPLKLDVRGTLSGDLFALDSLRLVQEKLLDLTGSGTVNLAGELPSFTGTLMLNRVEFPAAFASYAAIPLATSLIGDAKTEGSLTGEVLVRDNALTSLRVNPTGLTFSANKGSLFMKDIVGEVFWAPAGGTDAQVSHLAWSEGGAYGLSGGEASIEFVAYGANFALTRPAKLPVFDGAIAIDYFAMGNLGAKDMEVSFRGAVEPISMPLLAKAFGWPEFSGTIAAAIPGVRLKDDVLTFDGNVESQVFGGTIVGSDIRLQDPLGNFPQLFADVRARDLDLELVTRTFEVGTITGRLEADILGLHLFAWTPQSFDARLATPKGDKSRHRISAKAISNLSNVGGGGGGVVQALQSGVLRFFDDYSYEKLGIRCRLVGDVCEMSGIEPAGAGYYIVKGSGLPRIDIIGSQGRVNWNQLMSSIATADFGGTTVD